MALLTNKYVNLGNLKNNEVRMRVEYLRRAHQHSDNCRLYVKYGNVFNAWLQAKWAFQQAAFAFPQLRDRADIGPCDVLLPY